MKKTGSLNGGVYVAVPYLSICLFRFLGRLKACIDAYQLWLDRLNQLTFNNNVCLS